MLLLLKGSHLIIEVPLSYLIYFKLELKYLSGFKNVILGYSSLCGDTGS